MTTTTQAPTKQSTNFGTKANTTSRGYGWAHQKARKAALEWAVGSSCTRCGNKIESTKGIHFDHNDDRSGYLGWAHATCNIKAGARRGRAIQMTAVTA